MARFALVAVLSAALLGLGGLAVQLLSRSETWGSVSLFLVAGFPNIPAVPIIALIGALLDRCDLTGWPAAAAGVPCYWLGWYGIIRFLEWRWYSAAPVSVIPAGAPATLSTSARR
jgi:hypothetical protein